MTAAARTDPPETPSRLYERVAMRVRDSIDSGALLPGDRLPSVRSLREQERVSVSTVLQALAMLEDAGLIEARPQSGHYVRRRRRELDEPRVSTPPPKRTEVSVSDLVARVYAEHRSGEIVGLGTAAPATELLPARRLSRIAAAIARDRPDTVTSYDMPPGCLELRQQIARRTFDSGRALSPEEIVTTCGGAEAVTLSLLATTRRGDSIAIESPAYYGTLQAIEALGLCAVEVPTHPRHGVDVGALAQIMSQRKIAAVLLVPSFSNPVGSLMPDEHRKDVVQLLAKHDVPLIEDDVFGDLHFEPRRPRVAKAYDRKGLVLLCSSFSKTLAPGYRVGWVAAGRYRDRVEHLKFAMSLATATLPQLVIAEALESGGYDRHLRTLRRRFSEQVQRMTQAVGEHFPACTRVTRPQGGFVLWVELPPAVDALALHQQASQAGISIAPGPIFSPRREFSNFIRLSCGQPWSPRIEGAMMTLGSLVRQLDARGSPRQP